MKLTNDTVELAIAIPAIEIEIEELEPIIAPAGKVMTNHNETAVDDADLIEIE